MQLSVGELNCKKKIFSLYCTVFALLIRIGAKKSDCLVRIFEIFEKNVEFTF